MKVHKDLSLKKLNNLQIEVNTKYFVEIKSEEELQEFLGMKKYQKMPRFVLGGGCNIMFTKDFDGVVIKSKIPGLRVIKETKDYVIVESGSGVDWNSLVTFAVENNYGGIENMALIPGSVGASPIQNIAAYGQNLSDVFVSFDSVDLYTGKSKVYDKKVCGFSYRNSVFRNNPKLLGNQLITKVRVKLSKDPKLNLTYWSYKHGVIKTELQDQAFEPYTIKDVYNAIKSIRTRKFPNGGINTVGSFFKNPEVTIEKLEQIKKILPNVQYYPVENLEYIKNSPNAKLKAKSVKIAAGHLIDDVLGWKGKKMGHVCISPEHALVLVTDGNAKPSDMIKAISTIQKEFLDRFGIELIPEPVIL